MATEKTYLTDKIQTLTKENARLHVLLNDHIETIKKRELEIAELKAQVEIGKMLQIWNYS